MEQYEHQEVDRKILYKNFDENVAIEYEFFFFFSDRTLICPYKGDG